MPFQRERCSGLWRSEDMVHLDIIMQREALHDSVLQLGLLAKVQFVDVNDAANAFARPFAADIRYCEDLQRKMRFIDEQLRKDDAFMQLQGLDFGFAAPVAELREAGLLQTYRLHSIEERIDSTVASLDAMIACANTIAAEINSDEDVLMLYLRLRELMTHTPSAPDSGRGAEVTVEAAETAGGAPSAAADTADFSTLQHISSVLGLLPLANADRLRKMTYRVSRGNAVVEVFPENKTTVPTEPMASFAIFCSSRVMADKIRRLSSGLRATLYSVEDVLAKGPRLYEQRDAGTGDSNATLARGARPDGDSGAAAVSASPLADGRESSEVSSGIPPNSASAAVVVESGGDLRRALRSVRQRQRDLLRGWYREHRVYKTVLQVERAVYATMNTCLLAGSTATASVWVPLRYEPVLRRVLEDAVATSGGSVESVVSAHANQRHPPTYFETNKFTASFQSIVDSYGTARYKEVNPGVFTIITFPYLFGIMFGDIGHGILLLAVALFFIYKERHWHSARLNEIVGMLYGGRYLLLLMSLFAIYMGFLYNDFFGFSLNLFSSGYTWPDMAAVNQSTVYPTRPDGRPSVKPPHVYVFGLDSAWSETETKLEFYNSVKMKCSVIIGVLQMFAGVLLSLNNDINQRNWQRIAFKFVPEFVFLFCTFGYMSILIIVKWCERWDNTNDAPSILEIMTNFFLQPGTVPKKLFRGQAGLQVFLLIFAFLMVPVLLLGMPIVELIRYNQWRHRYYGQTVFAANSGDGGDSSVHHAPVLVSTSSLASGIGPLDSSRQHPQQQQQPGDGENAGNGVGNTGRRRGGGGGGPVMVSDSENSSVDLFGPEQPAPPVNVGGSARAGGSSAAHASSSGGVDGAASGPLPDDGEQGYGPYFDRLAAIEAELIENEKFLDFDKAEMMIHYVIHTIEYVLSSVSNTASYLRLWALSLAHAQLSEVFFTFAVVNVLDVDNGGALLVIGIFLWLLATLAVLVGMEALSAFLHALRLHWVEFQNKFYAGDGRAFEPFDLVGGILF